MELDARFGGEYVVYMESARARNRPDDRKTAGFAGISRRLGGRIS
jgi:hypothetical protein